MTNIISKEVAVAVENSTYNHARALDTMGASAQLVYDVLVAYIPKGFITKRKSFANGVPVSHYQDEIQQAWDIMPAELRNAIDLGHARAMAENFASKAIDIINDSFGIYHDVKTFRANKENDNVDLTTSETWTVTDAMGLTDKQKHKMTKGLYQVLHNPKADTNLYGNAGPSLKELIKPLREKGQQYDRTKNSRLLSALKGLHKVSNNVKAEVLPIKMRITKAYNTMLKTYNVSQKDSEAWIDKRDQDALVAWFDSYPFK
jgi:hypothetical protein